MTLSVTVHVRDAESGKLLDRPIDRPGATLAGFESWREAVYGSTALKSRGAHFLPHLAHDNLYIEGPDLPNFIRECETLLRDVDALAADTGQDAETLRFRLSNLREAAERASAIGGVIWIS